LHVEADAKAMLRDVDHFLRGIWLECCGHLSAFTIQGNRYTSHPEGMEDPGLEIPLKKVFTPGQKIVYEYDFGSTTELSVRVLSEGKGPGEDPPIRLLARNDPPSFSCLECGKPAMLVCTQCASSEEAALCQKCAQEHECGEEMALPLVNSPRAGVCGYTG